MMLSQPKPSRSHPYNHVPTVSTTTDEKKLRPFHAYRDFLTRVAIVCAVAGLMTLAFLVIASNLPLKKLDRSEPQHRPSRLEHFPVNDPNFKAEYEQFQKFMFKFNKRYENIAEKEQRFNNFRKTLSHIDQLNNLEKLTNTTFGLNDFSDMSNDEFRKMLMPADMKKTGRKNRVNQKIPEKVKAKMDTAYPYPKHFDWREKGVVTPVKNQNGCGSCWAFATACTVETTYAINHGELRSLSEQELLDCNLDNNACNGGDVDKAFDFVMKFGLMLEDEYPYVSDQTFRHKIIRHR